MDGIGRLSQPNRVSSATFAYPEVDMSARAVLVGSRRRVEPDGRTFVFDTCLRIEVVVAGGLDQLGETLARVFGDRPEVAMATVRHDADAVEHLYRVAAGLESPIRGEGEVFAQFRQSLARASVSGAITGIFGRLIEAAVAVGRRAREEMPGAPHDSLAAVAAQVVGGEDRVAVFGSGVMATAVVRALQSLPAPPPVTVVARSPQKVWLEAADIWGLDRTTEALETFPAVISATSAKKRLIQPAPLVETLQRRALPLTLVDMAMPPDFPGGTSPSLRYLGIDDLARLAGRRPRSDQADPLVRAGAREAFRAYSEHHQLGPIIGGLTRQADYIVDSTVARFGTRLSSEEDLAVLRQTAHTVARTLIAGPISYVKHPDRAPEALDVVAEAFGVED